MSLPPEQVRALALAAQAGSRQAFEQLVRLHKQPLYRFVRRYMGDADEAYDVVQDAFVSAWLNLRRFDPQQSFSAWLNTIALNKCRDRGRRNAVRRRITALFGVEEVQPAPAPDDDPQSRLELRLQRLDRAISRLPRQYKEALLLQLAGGLTQQQVAQQLGTTAKAVELRIRRARQKLAQALGDDPDALDCEG